jgi:hypothetical protein
LSNNVVSFFHNNGINNNSNLLIEINIQIECVLYHHNHQPILCFDQLDDQLDRLNDQLDAGQKPTFKNNEHLYLAQN